MADVFCPAKGSSMLFRTRKVLDDRDWLEVWIKRCKRGRDI
jgi:hypothetical protein